LESPGFNEPKTSLGRQLGEIKTSLGLALVEPKISVFEAIGDLKTLKLMKIPEFFFLFKRKLKRLNCLK